MHHLVGTGFVVARFEILVQAADRQQVREPGVDVALQAASICLALGAFKANVGIALVLRRGVHTKAPKVASVISRSGTPLGEPALRDTRVRGHEVTGGVPPHEVKVRLTLEKLLKLA